jgi:ABC-type bacteriocin/lantibiotic exporter with double-glycine peptidase domain
MPEALVQSSYALMITKRRFEQIVGAAKDVAATVAEKLSPVRRRLGEKRVMLDVPNRSQMDKYSCGLCSALMVAEFHGVRIRPPRINRFDEKHTDGTTAGPLVRFCRQNGFSVREFSDGDARISTITAALDAGIPPIVSITLPPTLFRQEETEHYLVVRGYDSKFFYVNDPSAVSNIRGYVPRARFRRVWRRDALLLKRRTRLRWAKPGQYHRTHAGPRSQERHSCNFAS